MSETIVYEPKPEYVVQIADSVAIGRNTLGETIRHMEWEAESYHFTLEDATDSANYLALSTPYVRVIKREVS